MADTYNSKIKVIDPQKRTLHDLFGRRGGGLAGDAAVQRAGRHQLAGGKLYVADTNAHRIRVVDLKTKAVSTLTLQGVEPPNKGEREASAP